MRRRKGLALAGVMALCLVAGSLLAWMFLSLSWSQESSTTEMRRSEERAVLSSQVEVCLHWIRAQLASGKPPRVAPDHVTGDPGSRKVFEDRTSEGAIAEVYDLEPPPSGPGTLGRALPFPGARDRLGDPRRPAAGWDGGDGAGRASPDLEGAVALRKFRNEAGRHGLQGRRFLV